MNDFKPRIFIGSSKEGLRIAKEVCRRMSPFAECKLWTSTFEFGKSAYEDLVSNLSLYDYGILIATTDDVVDSRGKEHPAARDNIIFEFGLFAGRLGRNRSFLMAESGIKIPSDLNGITLPFFPSANAKEAKARAKKAAEQTKKVIECCKAIRAHIQGRNKIFDYGFLPSTALAFGYYNNFVLKAVSNLLDTKTLSVAKSDSKTKLNGKKFKDLRLTILLPDNLSADMFDQVKAHKVKHSWEQIKIDAGGFRPFDFYVQAKKSNGGTLHMSDIPLTLNALNDAIRAYVGKSYVGVSDAEKLLETRELAVFKKVLDYLIDANPITKGRVKTELVDI